MRKFVANSIALALMGALAGGALAQNAPKAQAGEAPAPAGGEMQKLPPTQPGAARPAPAQPSQPAASGESAKPGQPGAPRPDAPKPAAEGQAEQPAAGQKPGGAAQAPGANPAAPGAADQPKPGAPRAGAAKAAPKITGEQRTTVVRSFRTVNARPVRVDSRLNVGVAVPRTVVLAPVPAEVITVVPEYEGYRFFETADSIVIVDPATLEIVAVLPL